METVWFAALVLTYRILEVFTSNGGVFYSMFCVVGFGENQETSENEDVCKIHRREPGNNWDPSNELFLTSASDEYRPENMI